MHDISAEVRTESAKLLGSMKSVSEKFLEQTLDKKLMSHMKFLRNCEQQRLSNDAIISEWATGRKYGEDAAVEKLDEDLAALIPSGACGAFVTGLEDEYLGKI
uniref:Uncharacterized protein n=1 Tax=Romanomermis culicivorax TaxID=13658 RepID=A0A915L9X8_ROMCU